MRMVSGLEYGLFDFRSAPRDYDLVVGMHPDGGTDHIIQYAIKHRKPFCVCPCCVIPSAAPYGGDSGYVSWINHLVKMAEHARFDVAVTLLQMTGRNVAIIGKPLK